MEVRTQFLAGFQALYLIAGESVSFKGAEPDAFNARYLSGSYRVGGCVSDIFPVAAEVYSGEDYLAVSGGRACSAWRVISSGRRERTRPLAVGIMQ